MNETCKMKKPDEECRAVHAAQTAHADPEARARRVFSLAVESPKDMLGKGQEEATQGLLVLLKRLYFFLTPSSVPTSIPSTYLACILSTNSF